jgi:hypothetical protein
VPQIGRAFSVVGNALSFGGKVGAAVAAATRRFCCAVCETGNAPLVSVDDEHAAAPNAINAIAAK